MIRWIKDYIEERREQRFVDNVLKYTREYELAAKEERFCESQDELVLKFFKGIEDERIPQTVDKVEAFTDGDMEMYHDFIQWIYPTIQLSNLHPDAPVISDEFAYMLAADQCAIHNYLRITRALTSLRETGHIKCSQRLYAALLNSLKFAPKHWVSKVTLENWKDTQKQED